MTDLAQDGETPRNRSLHMGPHHQIGINVDAKIASGPQGLNQSAVKCKLTKLNTEPYNFLAVGAIAHIARRQSVPMLISR